MLSAIQAYEHAYDAWLASTDDDEENCNGPLYRAFDAAENDLYSFPCRSSADVATKVRYLFLQENQKAKGAFEGLLNAKWDLRQFLNSLLGNEPLVYEPKPTPDAPEEKQKPDVVAQVEMPHPYRTWRDIPEEYRTLNCAMPNWT
ncbi:hypothetical protein DTW90_12055 [Neorhizobium sp. P12A]|nr:hypothetical protein DTW90_12055 [Neorhizobium sp. P12A]